MTSPFPMLAFAQKNGFPEARLVFFDPVLEEIFDTLEEVVAAYSPEDVADELPLEICLEIHLVLGEASGTLDHPGGDLEIRIE